jgi:hypothetical protein
MINKTKAVPKAVPKSMTPAYLFLKAGEDNREYLAYLAHRGTIEWPYSIPLHSVVAYLQWRDRHTTVSTPNA